MPAAAQPADALWFAALGSGILVAVVLLLIHLPGPMDERTLADQRNGLVASGPVVPADVAGSTSAGRRWCCCSSGRFPRPATCSGGGRGCRADLTVRVVAQARRSMPATVGGCRWSRTRSLRWPGRWRARLRDGGPGVGYAVVDAGRVTRYATLDPSWARNASRLRPSSGRCGERRRAPRRGAGTAYAPLGRRTLSLQLVVLVVAEVGLFGVYGSYDSRFHWGAHFLVGLIATAVWLSAVLLVKAAPARGQLLLVLVVHLFAMAPDLVFRAGVPHSLWMNVFLGHIAVHYVPGGDRTWLVLAVLATVGYCLLLSRWLAARHTEAAAGLAPGIGIGIGGVAVLRPQADPRVTPLAHRHREPSDRSPTGSPVLVLHGLGGTAQSLAGLTAALAEQGLVTLAADLLGDGESRGIGTRFRLPEQVDALVRLLDGHGLARVDVVAHSYGCVVAASLARAHPGRVGRLVLVCPPVFPDTATAQRVLGERSWLTRRTVGGAPLAGMRRRRCPRGRRWPGLPPGWCPTSRRRWPARGWPTATRRTATRWLPCSARPCGSGWRARRCRRRWCSRPTTSPRPRTWRARSSATTGSRSSPSRGSTWCPSPTPPRSPRSRSTPCAPTEDVTGLQGRSPARAVAWPPAVGGPVQGSGMGSAIVAVTPAPGPG